MRSIEVWEPIYLKGSKKVTASTYQPERERGKHFTPELHHKNTGAASQHRGKYVSQSYAAATLAERDMALKFMQAHHRAAYGRRFVHLQIARLLGSLSHVAEERRSACGSTRWGKHLSSCEE